MKSEDLIFSQLITNEEYARRVLPHIDREYFQMDSEKIFVDIYKKYFQDYNRLPSKQALLVEIEEKKINANEYKSLKEIITKTEEFKEDLDFLMKKTESFCKERALYNAIKESVLIADTSTKTDKSVGMIPSILQEALAVCFDTSVGHNYIDDAASRYEYYHTSENKVTTGLETFDAVTKKGPTRKTLNVILAPPHAGKSLTLVNIGLGALKAGLNVLYITAEMAAEEIARRFDVNMLDVSFDELEILPKNVFESKFNKLKKASFGKLVIKEYPTSSANVSHIKALLEELKTKQNFIPDIIVVDYLNIFLSFRYKNSTTANSYTTVKSTAEEFRALAIESNTAIWTATQTTRGGAGVSDIDMTGVSESFGLNATCDLLWALIVTDELKKMNQIMLKQLKNRYDDLNKRERFIMGIDRGRMRLYDIEENKKPSSGPAQKPVINTGGTGTFDDFNF